MSKQETALANVPRADIVDLDPVETKRKLASIAAFQAIVRKELKEGHDYGIIPGTGNKPTLLKPGAEKLAKLLNCFDDYEIIDRIEDWVKPLFRYLIRCTLSDMATGTKISSGLGECNSYESKYRFRWVGEDQVPASIDKTALKTKTAGRNLSEFKFAVDKAETTGQYGKPAEYWKKWQDAIKSGEAKSIKKATKGGKEYDAYELKAEATLFQVENADIFDQVNTILKMSKKRALVDAALSAGRLSDLFTQDLEDFVERLSCPAPAPTDAPREPGSDDDTPDPAPWEAGANDGGTTGSKFDLLDDFAKAKKALGNAAYYEILGGIGVEHANEIAVEQRAAVLKTMRAAFTLKNGKGGAK